MNFTQRTARICEFPGCGRPVAANGLCSSHRQQQLDGEELRPIRGYKQKGCSYPGCTGKHKGKGLCQGHFTQMKRGKELTPILRYDKSLGCSVDGCNEPVQHLTFCSVHYRDDLASRQPPCTMDDCDEPQIGDQLCGYHQRKQYRETRPPCEFTGCGRPQVGAYEWCETHKRMHENGDPMAPVRHKTANGEAAEFAAQAATITDPTSCVIWPYRPGPEGYGQITNPRMGEPGQPANFPAHRYVLILAIGGPDDPSLQACHDPYLCESRSCVNPTHLRWDTPQGNTNDKYIAGTVVFGESSPNAILSNADVWEIRWGTRYRGMSRKEIAASLGVSYATVSSIVTAKRWRHVTEDFFEDLGDVS